MTCNAYQESLAQFIADGEPVSPEYAAVRAHLAACGECRVHAARLRRVETALRAWPLAEVSVPLHRRLLATLRPWPPAPPAPRPAVSWSVWLPALTLVCALALTLTLAPLPGPEALPPAGTQSTLVSLLLREDMLTAIWMGIAVALAGIGLTVALGQGRLPNQDEIDSLRDRASHAADHFMRLAGHGR
jgi:anti-sigma factor RsiW